MWSWSMLWPPIELSQYALIVLLMASFGAGSGRSGSNKAMSNLLDNISAVLKVVRSAALQFSQRH